MPHSKSMEARLQQWGRNIAAARRELRLSQAALASAVGVRQSTVARWETGQRAPRDEHKIAIAHALRTEVPQMFPLVRTAA